MFIYTLKLVMISHMNAVCFHLMQHERTVNTYFTYFSRVYALGCSLVFNVCTIIHRWHAPLELRAAVLSYVANNAEPH